MTDCNICRLQNAQSCMFVHLVSVAMSTLSQVSFIFDPSRALSVTVSLDPPKQGGDLVTMPPLASHCWGVLACNDTQEERYTVQKFFILYVLRLKRTWTLYMKG